MPRTQRQHQRSHLYNLGLVLLGSAVSADDELAAILTMRLAKKQEKGRSYKWGPRGPYNRPKSEEFIDLVMERYSAKEFKSWIRMDRASFDHVLDLIRGDEIFISTGRRPQRPVKYQLATFLIRMGDMTGVKTANIAGIAEGTFYLYQSRIMKALRRQRDQHLSFPGPLRKDLIKSAMEEAGFPGCIGLMDCTLLRLKHKPQENWAAFWCYKKCYAIAVQATVDHRSIFTSYSHGWPGSVQDSSIWSESEIWKRREQYFAEDEYFLVDKGYPLTKYTIRPFADYDLTNNYEMADARRSWNVKLSLIRIKVEHAFGLLKGRFPAFRFMPGHNLQTMYKLVEAVMVLHNILIECQDDPASIEGYNGAEDEEVWLALQARRRAVREDEYVHRHDHAHAERLDGTALYQSGVARRKRLFELAYDVADLF